MEKNINADEWLKNKYPSLGRAIVVANKKENIIRFVAGIIMVLGSWLGYVKYFLVHNATMIEQNREYAIEHRVELSAEFSQLFGGFNKIAIYLGIAVFLLINIIIAYIGGSVLVIAFKYLKLKYNAKK